MLLFFNQNVKKNHHLQGNVQVYNVRIPVLSSLYPASVCWFLEGGSLYYTGKWNHWPGWVPMKLGRWQWDHFHLLCVGNVELNLKPRTNPEDRRQLKEETIVSTQKTIESCANIETKARHFFFRVSGTLGHGEHQLDSGKAERGRQKRPGSYLPDKNVLFVFWGG